MTKRWLKRSVLFIGIVVGLLIAFLIFLHTGAGKSLVRQKLESFLEKKWGSDVSIGDVDYRLPDWVLLKNITILDRHKDTLLQGGRLYVKLKMLKLLSNEVIVSGLQLEDISLYCQRPPHDSSFNFQFILDAFAPSDNTTSVESESAPLKLSVSQVSLHRIKLTYIDNKAQLYFSAFIGELLLRPDALDIEKTDFSLDDFSFRNSKVTIVDSSKQSAELPDVSQTEAGTLLLSLKRLNLRNIFFSYRVPEQKTDYAFRVDSLAIKEASLDLNRRTVRAKTLALRNTDVKLAEWLPATGSKEIQELVSASKGEDWSFAVQSINFDNNSFSYHNKALPKTEGIDVQHIDVKSISLNTTGNRFDSAGLVADLALLSCKYNDKMVVKDVSSKIRMTDNLLLLQNLKVGINESQIKTSGDIVLALGKNIGSSEHRFVIENSYVSFGDLMLLQPSLKKQLPLSLQSSDKILVSGSFSTTGQRLAGEEISIVTPNKKFAFKGDVILHIKENSPKFSATLKQLTVNRALISNALITQLQQEKIFLPKELTLKGTVQADARECIAKLKLNSEYGALLVDAKLRNYQLPKEIAYNLKLDANQFSPGSWMGAPSALGQINGQVIIDGKGMEPGKLDAKARIHLQSAVINDYAYTNINLDGEISQSAFTIRSRINDQNLQADLDLKGTIAPGWLVQGIVQTKKADLLKLGLTNDSIVYAGILRVNANYASSHRIDAHLALDSSQVFMGEKLIETGAVSVTCKSDVDTMTLLLLAPFADVQVTGNYSLQAFPKEIESAMKKLYVFNSYANEEYSDRSPENRDTWIDAKLSQDEFITTFFPELELKETVLLQGRFHAKQDSTIQTIHLNAPGLKYANYEVQDLQVTINADSANSFSLQASKFLNDKKQLGKTYITGQMQKGLLLVKGNVMDSLGKEFYAANVEVKKEPGQTSIRLLGDLTLNYNKWKLSADNLIRIFGDGYIVNNLSLENRGQSIRVASKEQQAISPINIKLENFDIGHLFTVLSPADSLHAKGNLTAEISLQQPIQKIPVLTGDIQATNLSVRDIPLGDLRFHSSNVGDSIELQGELSGANQLQFRGHIHLSNRGMEVQAKLDKFNTDIVKSLTKDFLNRVAAKITADINVKGRPDSLHYQGVIAIDSAAFALKALNTVYRLNKQKLLIANSAIGFENFTLTDSANNPLTVQGAVALFDPQKKAIDLAITASNFMALQTNRQPGALVYGTGIIDAALKVKGTLDEPVLEGTATLQSKSNVHVVSATKRNYVRTRKDGILFVKMDTLKTTYASVIETDIDTIVTKAAAKGLKYNLSLKVDKDAEFSVLVNPATGDELVMKGEGRLNFGLGKNGNTGIEGIYNLQSGYYKMNNLLLRGKFMLVKGSSISFSGDPELAEADVTTEYTVEASPKGLLNYKDDDNPEYSQRVPFAVILMIKGTIARPVLSFDIKLKPGKAVLKSSVKSDIEHALDRLRSDVTEMNKQVFSLLLAKQFSSTTTENTLESSNLNANNALKEGVSSFLTEAMDQVADQLIKNVDVDVSMKTYKNANDPVSKTDLGVAMSKDLFEDRLVIRIEENFAMGDQSSYPVKSGSQYVPDITSTYKLSKDGRFQLKAYQKNEYDAVVQGYFTEVGVNFTIELSYDKFKELMQRKKSQSGDNK